MGYEDYSTFIELHNVNLRNALASPNLKTGASVPILKFDHLILKYHCRFY